VRSCPTGNDAETTARTGAERGDRAGAHYGRVDLVLGAIAVDGGARSLRNDRADPFVDCAFDQFIDQRVFEGMKSLGAALAHGDEPFGIVPAGMRHGNQHRHIGSGRIDGRWG
jgi:hypothetical protein